MFNWQTVHLTKYPISPTSVGGEVDETSTSKGWYKLKVLQLDSNI